VRLQTAGRRAALIAALSGACALGAARAHADESPCAELAQQWERTRAELSAPQVSSLLFSVSDKGCAELAGKLLDAGASFEARDREGGMPLTHAARAGQASVVKLLLDRGAPINQRNLAGSTPLFVAVERGRLEAAQVLIERGADPNIAGRSGASPLAAAAFNGNDSVAALLLQHGADPKAADLTGKPPIVYAAARGAAQTVERLLGAGIDTNARYAHDLTALMWAAGYADGVKSEDGLRSVTLLLDRGARIEDADDRGRTALMIAAERGHADIVALLLKHGADAGRRDASGQTAASLASDTAVRELLPHG
jgi:ankyrin repeat protein